MDIAKWLEETAADVAPLQQTPAEPSNRPAPLPTRGDAVERLHRKHRQRRQTPSDSSFLDIDRPHEAPTSARKQERHSEASGTSASTGDSAETRSSSSDDSGAADRYERRPRHKTRPDLYDPKPEKKKDHSKQKRREKKDESKKSKRKSRRKAKDKPGAGLVQSFHAKNVAISRLTVRPYEVGHFIPMLTASLDEARRESWTFQEGPRIVAAERART